MSGEQLKSDLAPRHLLHAEAEPAAVAIGYVQRPMTHSSASEALDLNPPETAVRRSHRRKLVVGTPVPWRGPGQAQRCRNMQANQPVVEGPARDCAPHHARKRGRRVGEVDAIEGPL